MLISSYPKDWIKYIDAMARNAAGLDTRIYLLIDGVFAPGLYRKLHRLSPTLLFESLPGCNDDTRDVSPFLIQHEMSSPHVDRILAQCSGRPMISVIETSENQAELAERLAAWCIVEVDGQRFNFRFTDTRRLPAIFSVMTPEQKSQISGPAKRWCFIAREGSWQELPIASVASAIAVRPTILNEKQFASLVADSETDEILAMMQDRGYVIDSDPCLYYNIVSQALLIAQNSPLAVGEKLEWCELCVDDGKFRTVEQELKRFEEWLPVST